MTGPEILLRNDFTDLHPNTLLARDIHLLGVDIENLITDYGDPEVRPEVASHIQELRLGVSGLQVALVTNNRNTTDENFSPGFVDEVASQLGDIDSYYPDNGLKGKTSPDLFIAASYDYNVDPSRAAHADDQFKSYRGLRKAGYGLFIWTNPYGEHQHRGVKIMRGPEKVLRTAIATTHSLKEVRTSGF